MAEASTSRSKRWASRRRSRTPCGRRVAGGTVSSLGVYSGKLVAPYEAFYAGLGDQKIVTTLCPGGKERMRRLMEMIAQRRVDLSPLVTHRFALDNIAEAFDLFSHQRDGVLKVALYPEVAALRRAEDYGEDGRTCVMRFMLVGTPHRARRGPPRGLRRAMEADADAGDALSNDDSRRHDGRWRCGRSS